MNPSKDSSLVAEPHHTYQPLDLTKRQIRLIELLAPTKTQDQIRCHAYTYDLADAPPYTALSYRWGDASPTCRIWVDNQALEIRQNLYNFLKEYLYLMSSAPKKFNDVAGVLQSAPPRSTPMGRELQKNDSASVYLWIDQVSIEQSNIQERNQQVQLMSKIYRGADCVLCWLGSREERYPGNEQKTYYDIAQDFTTHQRRYDLDCLLENSYFQRLWVAQEILLAKCVFILIGDRWISWDEMRTCFIYTLPSYDRHPWIIRTGNNLLRMSISSSSYRTLRVCVDSFCQMQCSDARDKVYGLMGLVDPKYALAIDYTKSAYDVCLDVFEALLRSHLAKQELNPNEAGSSKNALNRLTRSMGFTQLQKDSFLVMLWIVWSSQTLQRLMGSTNPKFVLGFDPTFTANREGMWWYEIEGDKFDFPCTKDFVENRLDDLDF